MNKVTPIILLIIVTLLVSCSPQDNFYEVTKVVVAPDTITINQEFKFKLILRNDTTKELKLTIDDDVLKSLSFNHNWYCDEDLLVARVPNPKSESHNYHKHYLKQGDSLVYTLSAVLSANTENNLSFSVKGYDRVYTFPKPKCKVLKMYFGGMWNPGDFNPLDAMEGYNFSKEIIIIENSRAADNR